jgi:hypothetical protein
VNPSRCRIVAPHRRAASPRRIAATILLDFLNRFG